MSRVSSRGGLVALGFVLGLGALTAGCSGDYLDAGDGSFDGSEMVDEESTSSDDAELSSDDVTVDEAPSELGTSQQALLFFNPFNFTSSCSDSKGTNSVMAALAVATATELKRWQPTKDFQSSGGMLKLTATGKAQCADGQCWNTQAILDLQNAPAGKVQVRPGVIFDGSALKSALTGNLTMQILWLISALVPEHKLSLVRSEPGGCDQFYWFNVTSPSGGAVSSLLTSTLNQKLKWVGGSGNPYIQFQSNGTMVGIDPTYGLNQAGSTAAGSCTVACTKMSSTDITGACCSCNGTKKFSRSAWSATTYICQ
jgi:hypothetical protein